MITLSRTGGREFHHQHSISSSCRWSECLLSPVRHRPTKSKAFLFFAADLPLKIPPCPVAALLNTKHWEQKKDRTHSHLRWGCYLQASWALHRCQRGNDSTTPAALLWRREKSLKLKKIKWCLQWIIWKISPEAALKWNLVSEVFAYFMSNKRSAQLHTIVAIILAPDFSCSGYTSAQVILCIH